MELHCGKHSPGFGGNKTRGISFYSNLSLVSVPHFHIFSASLVDAYRHTPFVSHPDAQGLGYFGYIEAQKLLGLVSENTGEQSSPSFSL